MGYWESNAAVEPDSAPEGMDPAEWECRVKLAAAYRIFDELGWSLVIFNHLTMRVPGSEHHFLINPYGLRYDEVTASNLVKIDTEGNVLSETEWGINPAGFTIHSAIHQAVPEALCVMHTHTNEGLAVACKASGLTNTNFYSAMIHGHVAYHDFEGVTEREDEKPRLLASLGTKPFAILRNHGLLVHGRTIEEGFARMWTLQKACEAQVMAEALAGPTIQVTEEATVNSTRVAGMVGSNQPVGAMMFNAMMRKLDQRDPSYRQ